MNRSVRSNPDQLRHLRNEIQRSREEINNAVRRINSGLANASSWQDLVRTRFEHDLRDALIVFKKFDADSDRLCAHLDKKAQQLDDFLRYN